MAENIFQSVILYESLFTKIEQFKSYAIEHWIIKNTFFFVNSVYIKIFSVLTPFSLVYVSGNTLSQGENKEWIERQDGGKCILRRESISEPLNKNPWVSRSVWGGTDSDAKAPCLMIWTINPWQLAPQLGAAILVFSSPNPICLWLFQTCFAEMLLAYHTVRNTLIKAD